MYLNYLTCLSAGVSVCVCNKRQHNWTIGLTFFAVSNFFYILIRLNSSLYNFTMFEGERNIEKQHLKTTSESEQAIINGIEL